MPMCLMRDQWFYLMRLCREKTKFPKDAVLLIPEPEQAGSLPAHGVKPGYYNAKQMLQSF